MVCLLSCIVLLTMRRYLAVYMKRFYYFIVALIYYAKKYVLCVGYKFFHEAIIIMVQKDTHKREHNSILERKINDSS